MADIAYASSPATKFFRNPSSNDESPTYCFMSKASKEKVSSQNHKVHFSDQYYSDEDDHAKLIKIAIFNKTLLRKLRKPSGNLKGYWLRRWMVRSVMCLTDLPLSFWGYALKTNTFTLNRAQSKSIEAAPYEL